MQREKQKTVKTKIDPKEYMIFLSGATSEIRTPDPRITSALLWPTELRWRIPSRILYTMTTPEKGFIAKNAYFWENECPLF